MIKQYHVYIMSNHSKILYTGVSGDLLRRVYEHKQELIKEFTKKYHLTMLVYHEATTEVLAALRREKQIKSWLRSKKIALIECVNPEWVDLSDGWYEAGLDPSLSLRVTTGRAAQGDNGESAAGGQRGERRRVTTGRAAQGDNWEGGAG